MLRALVYGLAVLHLGPGIAFAVLAFGCEPSQALLGAVCGKDSLTTFGAITVAVWVVLGAASAVMLRRQRVRRGRPASNVSDL